MFFSTMMINFSIFSVYLLLAFAVAMADEKALKVSQGNNLFSKELYKILSKGEGNVFFSPLSAHTILSLVHQGAAGKTNEALERALHLPQKDAQEGFKSVMTSLNNIENVTLHIANKVYVQQNYKLKSSFQKIAVDNYFADSELLNFADNTNSANAINKWVEDKTNKKIQNLIDPSSLDSLTRMVLVNAIYFKGDWLHQFKKTLTKKEKFYTSNTDSIDVDMMFQEHSFRYADLKSLDAQVLELPYKNKAVSMIIILPKARDGITELEKKLETFDLTTLDKQLHQVDVKVSLPKFKIATTMKLNEPLKEVCF